MGWKPFTIGLLFGLCGATLAVALYSCGLAAPSPTPARLTPAAVVRAWRAAGLAASGPTPTASVKDWGEFFTGAPVGACTTWVVLHPDDAARPLSTSGFVAGYVADCPDAADEDRLFAHLQDRRPLNAEYTILRNRNLLLTFWGSTTRPADLSSHKAVFLGLR